jgi:pimeloyl-ACP methyl ester carboxylesterase
MRELAPFEQLPYDEVPEHPRVAHGYFATEALTVRVPTRAFGPLDVHVRRHGSGPPLVLVHGFMTSSYSWRYVIEPLGRSFTVYVPDLPGSGASDKPDAPYAPTALAGALGDVIAALGVRGAPVIGNSLGGYLAMWLALLDPQAMSRLACIHAPGLPTPRMWALRAALEALPFAPHVIDALVRRDPRRWVHRNVHYFDETLKSREEHAEYARPLETPEGRRAFLRMLDDTLDVREMNAFERRLVDCAGRFPVPLLLLYARRDPMVPPEIGARLGTLLPTARLRWIDRGSHFMHVDAPEAFLDEVLPFLA